MGTINQIKNFALGVASLVSSIFPTGSSMNKVQPAMAQVIIRENNIESGLFTGEVINSGDKNICGIVIRLQVSKDRSEWNVVESENISIPFLSSINPIDIKQKVSTKQKYPWYSLEITAGEYCPEGYLPTARPTIKPTSPSKPTIRQIQPVDYSKTIDCIGPDGREFNTTEAECKKLNEAWGRQNDYIVNCSIHTSCGGGKRRMKKSECDNMTCCLIDQKCGGPRLMTKAKCDKTYCSSSNSRSANSNVPDYPPCAIYYPALGYSQTYLYTSPETCRVWQNNANAGSKIIVPATPIPTKFNYAPSTEQILNCKENVKISINNLMRGCYIQFEGSAADACSKAYQSQSSKYNIECQNTGTHSPINNVTYIAPTSPPPKVPIGYP